MLVVATIIYIVVSTLVFLISLMESVDDNATILKTLLASLSWPLLLTLLFLWRFLPQPSNHRRDIEARLKQANLMGSLDPRIRYLIED